jgi:hypothetical protein
MMNGIGATDELRLRVSVAALVRALFEYPKDGELMLALERKATLFESEHGRVVEVKTQPFGGAIRIHNMSALQDVVGDFHFDSEGSRSEQDLRIFIRPANWKEVREFCLRHLSQLNDSVLESDPRRELTEEFADTLKIRLKQDQYIYGAIGTIVEDLPSSTANAHARGFPTVRMYRIFEARILDPALAAAMIESSESWSDQGLYELAMQDARTGGPGRANAVLTLPLNEINAFYRALTLEARNRPVFFENHQLDETVAAILEGVPVPKYRRL